MNTLKLSVYKQLKVNKVKMQILAFRKGLAFLLITVSLILSSCDPIGLEDSAETIEDAISQITSESAQWRKIADETRSKLPEELRGQVDLAFDRAIASTGREARCNIDFVENRLKQNLKELADQLRQNQKNPTIHMNPHVCQVEPPGQIIELDSNLRPKGQNSVVLSGYDLDSPGVQVLLDLVDENGNTVATDLTDCCLDLPTHYSLTIDLAEVTFLTEHRRIRIVWPNAPTAQTSVGISHAPKLPPDCPLESNGVLDSNTDNQQLFGSLQQSNATIFNPFPSGTVLPGLKSAPDFVPLVRTWLQEDKAVVIFFTEPGFGGVGMAYPSRDLNGNRLEVDRFYMGEDADSLMVFAPTEQTEKLFVLRFYSDPNFTDLKVGICGPHDETELESIEDLPNCENCPGGVESFRFEEQVQN